MRFTFAVVIAALMFASPAVAHERLDFRGQAIVPTGTTFAGTTVGGLSSITYDKRHDRYYILSDDQSNARFYTARLDVRDGRLTDGDVRFTDVTTLLAPNGAPYPTAGLDPEGLVLTKDRRLILTSEGIPATLIDPFVRRYRLDGSFVSDLPVPQAFRVTADQSSGVRPNLGFEAAGTDGRHFYTATENALFQDGPGSDDRERQPLATAALRPAHEPARAPVGLRDRPGRGAVVPPPCSPSTGSSRSCRSTTTR